MILLGIPVLYFEMLFLREANGEICRLPIFPDSVELSDAVEFANFNSSLL